ncbi:MAG: helix-turn-helix domain-containing protein [Ardenticatenaceae bacterium]|nr:helix-turn-helix domain-containing protein [Ardenticatenaceae bacterium]MCB8938157.1 helix-turn-helix domain-containing protein [Ardenticatenaceae bacterium]MCB8938384.1 helix-turn-helix domain-containing protein [Ardenticatenaceae bacterium]MCB8939182.1 helix-turn-helix domain-containing protein [Ardenticatenaceae bacterium]MCB8939305.1 helix-turn-helix domain-containing protein [Ardenticatenaceae bacterium]
MPKRRYLELTAVQKSELVFVRDHHEKSHMREKAAILLKIASGMSPNAAAKDGGHKPHHPDTIYKWLDWYEQDGLDRLEVQKGRGRKAAFSPSVREAVRSKAGTAPGDST